ncbi:Pectate lyase superfamily protein [Fontibacillus panacisegetis]|uniref:Pectate lyase superfamily protein n=1 Tax=Fontibacillus panacisegetis TaxID=670482 RepID=A0A1G7T8J0_9BACL|nr:glycosyl hydrolase family 28-related protein [Fontibacillus panacisegetis]SDG31677.1 Pectate lyase superfamily protein [Fontibacillus panacisegetis]
MINVKNLGARGNGRHDDTAVIQKAFQLAAQRGDTVYFPNGVYMINPEKSLKISSGTIVKGTGGSAVIKADSKYFGMELIRIEGDDISISSISFDGNNRVNRVVVIGGGSHRINISNSFVANAAHSSDPDSDYYIGVVSGITVYGNSKDIVITGTKISNILATNLTSGSLIARGIYVTTAWESTETIVRNLLITGCYIHHVEPADDGDGIYIEDRAMDHNEGQDVYSIISNNRFDHCAKRAIKIYANGTMIVGNQITNTYLNNNYYKGTDKGGLAPDMYSAISIYGSNHLIESNMISGSGSFYSGIEVDFNEAADDITIQSNSISMGDSSNIQGKTAIRLGNIVNFKVLTNHLSNGERGIWIWKNANSGLISNNDIKMQGGGIDLSTYLPGYVQSNIMCSFNRIQAPKYTIQTAPSNQNVVIM